MDNINVIYMNMPCKIKGFAVYNTAEDFYTIVLNSRHSISQNQKTYQHELTHIKNGDFYSDANINLIENYSH